MRVRFLLVIFLAVLSVAARSQPEDPSLRKEIEAVYAKWDSLVAKRDIKGLWAMIDPSFVGVDLDGRAVPYAEGKEHFEQMMAQMQGIRSRIKVDHVYGDHREVCAWVTLHVTWEEKVNGRAVRREFSSKFAETLRWTGKGWRFTYSQMLPDFRP